ncbi:MFS transporter [Streptomyces rectiviolaceus]|uniref:MFS transporter n=2 Tax=Streptomyces rectiviolaceus TaxID=332591 RepID=A0ABP6MBQ1_9ACTN
MANPAPAETLPSGLRPGEPATSLIDDTPVTGFHRRLTAFCSGGPFLDGFALGVVGLALPQIARQWQLSGLWQGALAAAALLGILVGGLVFGYVTDLVGRKVMYSLNIAAIAVCAAAQFFVTGPEQLLVLRVLLGVTIGADYPIASSLLAEFAPRRSRPRLIGLQTIMWSAGNATAYLVGDALLRLGPDAWRWILVSPAVPALALAFLRAGTPESPRWLLSKGRTDEALRVMRKVYGPGARLDGIESRPAATKFRQVFQGVYLRRTLFVAVFWTCSVTPVYALYSFAPTLLDALGIDTVGGTETENLGSVAIGLLLLAGTVVATLVAGRVRRRTLLILPFAVASASLLALGLVPETSVGAVVVLLGVYALFIGGPTILQWIYPNEIYPTEIRATAFGVGVATSRVGAVLGTFVVPLLLAGVGVSATMLVVGAISAVGAVVSALLAPETHGHTLDEAARDG